MRQDPEKKTADQPDKTIEKEQADQPNKTIEKEKADQPDKTIEKEQAGQPNKTFEKEKADQTDVKDILQIHFEKAALVFTTIVMWLKKIPYWLSVLAACFQKTAAKTAGHLKEGAGRLRGNVRKAAQKAGESVQKPAQGIHRKLHRKIHRKAREISKRNSAKRRKRAAGAAALLLGMGIFWAMRTDGNGKPAGLSGAGGFADFTGKIPLAETFHGMLTGAQEAAASAREQAEESLRAGYRAILDEGKGDSFTPKTETQRAIWEEVRASRIEDLQRDPFLLLVNKWHFLPDDYEADPVDLPNGQRIDRACYEPLMRMLEDCAEAGGTPIVCSGYRPHWYQENLFDAQINRWLYAGYGQEEARELAATAVAIPGTSEHELGLAADIYSSENMNLDESQIYTFTQQWLMENCWRYGFILRYPLDKSGITGIIFEPWHYRYVGEDHAKKIFDAGICLEEYLDEAAESD